MSLPNQRMQVYNQYNSLEVPKTRRHRFTASQKSAHFTVFLSHNYAKNAMMLIYVKSAGLKETISIMSC